MNRPFDLEERTTKFAKAVIGLCKKLPRSPINDRLIAQVVGSAGSVGANYREAKESQHWLELILEANDNRESEVAPLIQEADELKRILSAIIEKTK